MMVPPFMVNLPPAFTTTPPAKPLPPMAGTLPPVMMPPLTEKSLCVLSGSLSFSSR